jgi:hypothetical protein
MTTRRVKMEENEKMESAESKGPAEGETKNEKFKRLAAMRVTNALKKIGLIGNLAGSGYESSAEEVEKIISALKACVGEVEEKFQKKTGGGGSEFTL